MMPRRAALAAHLAALFAVSESASLDLDSSAELAASLPFVRFALADLRGKSREPHVSAFLQQTEVKHVIPRVDKVPEVVPAKQMATAVQATLAPTESPQAIAQPPAMVSQPKQPATAQPIAPQPVVPQPQNQTEHAVATQKVPPTVAVAIPTAAATPLPAGANSTLPQALVSHGASAKKMSPTTVAATFSLALIVKILCMLSNVACHVSPLPQVQQFHKAGDTGEADSAPLMSILYSGSQWVFYGNFAYCMTGKSGFLVLVYANITGLVLGCYYVWGFQQNCRDQKALQQLQLYLRAAAFVFSLQFLAVWSLSFSSALFFSGLMASLSSIIGACSLCSTLPKVIKTQCSASINLELLIVGICSSVLWVSCGVMLWDAWILLPTLFGLVIQLACGFFVLLFPREEQGDLIHLPSRSPICCWVLPKDCEQLEDSSPAPRRALAGRAAAAAAQIRAALRSAEQGAAHGDYGSTAAGAGTGGTC